MSDAVMSESSQYRDSIKFYERMSDLQGELKNYESQEFQLEEEFQRLWTQGINPESSSASVAKEPPTQSEAHRGELGHLTKSQLLANPSNLNYYGKNEEAECRRRASARNQGILDKLQELETNASIFAARSERLRMMRNEYETLVRKYASNRKRDYSEVKPSYYNHSFYNQSFSSVTPSPKTGALLKSTGVNTDITGPIRPISLENDILPRSLNIIEGTGRQPEKLLSSLKERRESDFCTEDGPIYNKTTRPTFLDISSTSESEFTVPKLKQYLPDNFDDTSADTTSLSVLLPKPRGSNYLLNVTTEGSLTESTSTKQAPIRESVLKRNTIDPMNAVLNTTESRTTTDALQDILINSISDAPGGLIQENGDECSSSSDSTSNSIGDSVMDSIQNKTPDSLPKEDSELLHITEVDEKDIGECENQHPRNEKKKPTKPTQTALINEMGSQNQETWDNLSSSNLVRVAQKEIGIRYSGEPKVVQSDDTNQHTGRRSIMEFGRNVDFDSRVEKSLMNNKGCYLGQEIGVKDESLIQNQDGFLIPAANTLKLSSPPTTSSSSSSSLNVVENTNRKSPPVIEKVEGNKADPPPFDYEVKKSSEEYAKSKRTLDDSSSPIVKPKNPNLLKPSMSDPFFKTPSDQKENKQVSTSSNSGNESKKFRLKFDYDDTESDASDADHINKGRVKPLLHQQPTKLNVQDDEFDGFFD